LAFGLEGADSANLSEPPSPAVASQERADEAVENCWMALLRDVPFTDYATDPMVSILLQQVSFGALPLRHSTQRICLVSIT
jgi:hypothetical protein